MKRFVLLISLIITSCLMMTACGSASSPDAGASDMGAAERVLRAMTECPNDELYHPSMTVIGLGAPAPTEEESAAQEKAAEEEKAAWQAAVGDCFADGMFDNFYRQYERTQFLSEAYVIGLTTSVKSPDIIDKEEDDNVKQMTLTIEATDETGHVDTYDTVWLVIYDKTDPKLLQSVELLVDGGFFCRAGCEIPGK